MQTQTVKYVEAAFPIKIVGREGQKVFFVYDHDILQKFVIDLSTLDEDYRRNDALPVGTRGFSKYHLLHSHQCKWCKTIWSHEGDAATRWTSHDCPNCKRMEFCVYFPDKPEDCSRT